MAKLITTPILLRKDIIWKGNTATIEYKIKNKEIVLKPENPILPEGYHLKLL